MTADKNTSKGISLFIKSVIFIMTLYYVFHKLSDIHNMLSPVYFVGNLKSNYFLYALVLVFFNWGFEAIKWKYMIKKIEYITFSVALKSVFAGVSTGIFTPNRVGEFAGKVFYIKTPEKLKATLISVVGSVIQLLVTITVGIMAAIIYYKAYNAEFPLSEYISFGGIIWTISIVVVIVVFVLWRYYAKTQIAESFVSYNSSEFIRIFFFSAARYVIFSIQYYLVLLAFGIDAGILKSLLLIAFVFFANTLIPTFALTEIAVRSASGVFFFSLVTADANAIVASSITLWIINLLLPALIGLRYVWQLRFFSE